MISSDFKLALNGQIYDSEGLLYAYPEKVVQLRASGQYPAWINALPQDSRFLRELVVPGGECFSVRYNQEGLFYSFTKYNPHDARNGVVSITLHTQAKAITDAKQLIIVLRNLMDYFLEKNSPIGIQDADIENLLKDITSPYTIKIPAASTTSALDAYRVYQDDAELQKCLRWAIQKEYTRYKWVHFVSAANKRPTINPALYNEIATRLAECYAIKRSDGTYELTLAGTGCSYNYQKDGYMPQTISFTVGQPSPYVTIDADNVVHIKPLSELNLKFKKRITVKLFDATSGAPIVENGMQVCKTVEVEEGKQQGIFLAAEGYQPKTVNIDPAKFPTAEGSITQTLQRVKGYAAYDNFNGNQEEKKDGKKSKIILFLIALILGGCIGFAIPKFFLTSPAPEVNNTELDSIKNLSADYLKQIEQLKKDTIDLNKKIADKDKVIQDKDAEISKLKNSKQQEEQQKNKKEVEDANKKALEYLNSNSEWSLGGMTTASGNPGKVGLTDAYKFLKTLVLASKPEDLDKVLEMKGITNPIWKEQIVPKIMEKKETKSKDIFKFIKTSNKKPNTPQNGELKLNDLYNHLLLGK